MDRRMITLIVATSIMVLGTKASDPELLVDFAATPGVTVDGNFFTFTGFRAGVGAAPGTFKAVKATAAEFPVLSGLGVSYALLEFQPGAVNPPHTHPRGTELLFVLQGSLTVAVVDTSNKLFKQTLQQGDVFVFPKGLVHYQINLDTSNKAMAISAFSSAAAGTVSLPATLFGSGISDAVLTSSFKVPAATIHQLEAPFATKA